MRWLQVGLAAGAGLLAGCGGNDAGPCVMTEREPPLQLTRVTSTTGERLTEGITVDRVTVDGRAADLRDPATGEPDPACTLPCALGHSEGSYRFRVSAPGHRPETVTAEGAWGRTEGGCPGSLDDGAEVEVELTPQG